MVTSSPSIHNTVTPQRIVQAIVDAARRAADAVANAYHRRQLMSELEALDDRTLHDIGVRRAELGSLVAELTGAAPPTRRQTVPSASGRAAVRA